MRRMNKVRLSIVLTSMLSAFTVVANSENIGQAQLSTSLKAQHQDRIKQCHYNPDECTFNALGAGNGGGNEPPYTPRKKKKKATTSAPEI